MSKKNQKASIIVVNWNGKQWLEGCLGSLLNQNYSNFEIILVDNGSEDGSPELIEEKFPSVKLICLKENTGFAKGNNVGIKKALQDRTAKYVACLNNDTKTEKDWLTSLIECIEKSSKTGMVSSLALFPDGKVQNAGLFVQNNDPFYAGGMSIGFNENRENYQKKKEIFASGGVAALYRREMLEDIEYKGEYFDEDFFAYGEDVDLGWKGRLLGWKAYLCSKAELTHYHSKTSGAASPLKAFLIKRNGILVVFKNYSFADIFKYIKEELKTNATYFFKKKKNSSVQKLSKSVGTKGMVLIVIKAYWGAFKMLPIMMKKRKFIQNKKNIDKKEYKEIFRKFTNETD
ncbi:MAG: glycosyltransferase family 2 protein [Candidatus Moranbacteria bacterium]|nr:glycosyltransferase family 2 protein [Candidatus Moranbacteria bacterium]